MRKTNFMFFLPVLVKSSQALLNLWWSWSRRYIDMQIYCLPPCFSSPWGVLAHLSVHRGNPSVPLAMPSLPNIFTCTGFSTGNRNESEVFQRWLRLEKTSIKPYNWNHQLNCRKKKVSLYTYTVLSSVCEAFKQKRNRAISQRHLRSKNHVKQWYPFK